VSQTLSSEAGAGTAVRPSRATLVAAALAAVGPGAITFYLAFRSGGYFAGAPAIVAVVLGVALMLRLVLAEDPFEGFGPALICAASGLGLYAVWTLASALWSHAPAQALIEFDRALMYWLGLVLFGSFGWTRERMVWAVRMLTLAMVLVAIASLVTRVLPELHHIQASIENDRLSYPLSYWNAVGIFAAVTIVFCIGLATRREEVPWVKALAAGAVPLVTATLYFCFSRGALVALALGLVAFFFLCLRRELIAPVLSIAPPTIVAVLLCLGTHALSTKHYADATGVSEGHTLTLELIGCALVAAALRLATAPLDRRLDRIEIAAATRRRAWIIVGVAAALIVVVGGIAVDAPHRIGNGIDKFTESGSLQDPKELQDRYTTLNNNGRVVQWELGWETFEKHPLLGTGAGTYGQVWAKEGSPLFKVVNAHSIYFETLSNLGAPGLIFFLLALFSIMVGLALRIRGPDRILYAATFAAVFTWAVHAGFDWDWEMPATGFFIFGLGGMAIAARATESPAASGSSEESGSSASTSSSGSSGRGPGRALRVALGIGCLALVVSPGLVAISQGMLNSAVRDLQEGNCGQASREALDAIHVLSVRPDPYQVLGFCDSRAGEHQLAIQMLETAVDRDPDEWESYYGLALVKGAAGEDPRPAARKAHELAPHVLLTEEAVEMFDTNDPQKWERRARQARLPIL
jgi:hypothetical protein